MTNRSRRIVLASITASSLVGGLVTAFERSGVSILRTSAAVAFTQEAKLTASDAGSGDGFGEWLAIDGDTLVVGAVAADNDHGAAYVFVKSGGAWTEQAKLVASDRGSGDRFGTAVSVDGDTVVVAARKNDSAADDAGAAYVFVRNGGSWTQQAKLTAADAGANDKFGDVVSIDGDTVLVGARSDSIFGNESGSAYVFVRTNGNWSQQAKLTPNDGAAGDKFGDSAALDGDTAVLGASFDDAPKKDSGSGYVFVRSNGRWAQQARLIPPGLGEGDQTGFIAALHGGTAVLGAPYHDGAGSDSGSAAVFVKNGTTWSFQQRLAPLDPSAGDVFGFSVRVQDERVVVGSRLDDGVGGRDSGSAYVFDHTSQAAWAQSARLNPGDAASADEFGDAVELDGGTVVVGAPHDDGKGSTYVFGVDLPESTTTTSSVVSTSTSTTTSTVPGGTTTSTTSSTSTTLPAGGTTPVFKNATTASAAAATSLVLNSPPGASSELLLALIRQRKTTGTVVAPPGWNLIRQDGTSARSTLFYKVATGSESGSYTFTTNIVGDLDGHVLRYAGVDTASPILGHGVRSNTGTSSGSGVNAPRLTSAQANARYVAFWSARSSGLSVATPPGVIRRTLSSVKSTVAIADGAIPSVDQKATLSASSDRRIGQAVLLKPAPGP